MLRTYGVVHVLVHVHVLSLESVRQLNHISIVFYSFYMCTCLVTDAQPGRVSAHASVVSAQFRVLLHELCVSTHNGIFMHRFVSQHSFVSSNTTHFNISGATA